MSCDLDPSPLCREGGERSQPGEGLSASPHVGDARSPSLHFKGYSSPAKGGRFEGGSHA
jgi:hypothetical protein